MAVANYNACYDCLPPAYLVDEQGRPMHSWRVLILPFLEERQLYDQYDFSQPWNSAANQRLADQMPPSYAFHGDYYPGQSTTNYLAVVGPNTMWPGTTRRTYDQVTDATSSTISHVENHGLRVHWMEPRDLNYETMSFLVNDPNGISSKYVDAAVAMADGTLRRLKPELPPEVLRALLSVDGGEILSEQGNGWSLLRDGRDRQRRDTGHP